MEGMPPVLGLVCIQGHGLGGHSGPTWGEGSPDGSKLMTCCS